MVKIIFSFLFIGVFIFGTTIGNGRENIVFLKTDAIESNTASIDVLANSSSHWLLKSRTKQFILDSQDTEANTMVSMDQIYFRLGIIKLLDPTLSNLSSSDKTIWTNQILSLQNPDGGFGGWAFDTSSLSHTSQALEALTWLNAMTSVNSSLVSSYLDSLRITLTNGYGSNKYDSDADIYSTSQAVSSYDFLGLKPANFTDVADVFYRGQNINDTNYVRLLDFGGFGAQSNHLKNPPIVWTSELVMTRAALFGLNILGVTPADQSAAIAFLDSLQEKNSADLGGFMNYIYNPSLPLPVVTGPYTATAIETILTFNGTFSNNASSITYLKALENSADGGFKHSSTSAKSSLRGTYYAVLGLTKLGKVPTNVTKTLDYSLNYVPDGLGGFGQAPGETASLRETFDGVQALSLMHHVFTDLEKTSISNYVASYYNPDGGYGILGSYAESTLRAIEVYNILGLTVPNKAQTITFLQSLQRIDGGFEKSIGKGVSYVISTYRVIKALDILGAKPTNVAGAITYLKNIQNATDGGFGGFSGDTSDVTSTYRAVSALNILGATSSTYDVNKMISFIKNSQNPDGGFRRGVSDTSLPKNVSNMIHTYSAVRTLLQFNDAPNNASGVYYFVLSTRNSDGGFAEHARFTSDIAYTFTGLSILSDMDKVSGFKLVVPTDLSSPRIPTSSFTIGLYGKLSPFLVNVTDNSAVNILSQVVNSEQNISIDISSLTTDGTYTYKIQVEDQSGAVISLDLKIVIKINPTSSQSTTSTGSTPPPTSETPKSSDAISFSYFLVFLGSLVVLKKKRNQ